MRLLRGLNALGNLPGEGRRGLGYAGSKDTNQVGKLPGEGEGGVEGGEGAQGACDQVCGTLAAEVTHSPITQEVLGTRSAWGGWAGYWQGSSVSGRYLNKETKETMRLG
jgi:hypothetical protein